MAHERVTTYPTPEQYDRWMARKEHLGMGQSEFLKAMVEAGIKADKGFEAQIVADETNAELREQRDQYRRENERLRERIEKLENRATPRETEATVEHVEKNPGAQFESIATALKAGVEPRLTANLQVLEGDRLRRVTREGGDIVEWYPIDTEKTVSWGDF